MRSLESSAPLPVRSTSDRWRTTYLSIGIVGSLAIHLSLLKILAHRHPPPITPTAFSVEFVPPSPTRNKQAEAIVAPPEVRPGEPPKKAYRSDTDNVVVREEIKRGDAPDAAPVIGKGVIAPPSPESAPQKALEPRHVVRAPTSPSRPPPLKHLALDPQTVLRDFSSKESHTEPPSNDPLAAPESEYRAFSRPRGSGAAIVGLRGNNDYLPNLPDGDLTLLNTKANRFAVFVRRVATQVFGQLRRSGWEHLQPGDINRINDHTTVLATLSASGKLLKAELLAPSGSARFDEVVLDAVKKGAQDPHPPPGAESSDGTIKFIFKSKSWVRLSADPRGPGFGERRWILLGTGLE